MKRTPRLPSNVVRGPVSGAREFDRLDAWEEPVDELRSPLFWIAGIVFGIGFWAFVALCIAFIAGPA